MPSRIIVKVDALSPFLSLSFPIPLLGREEVLHDLRLYIGLCLTRLPITNNLDGHERPLRLLHVAVGGRGVVVLVVKLALVQGGYIRDGAEVAAEDNLAKAAATEL